MFLRYEPFSRRKTRFQISYCFQCIYPPMGPINLAFGLSIRTMSGGQIGQEVEVTRAHIRPHILIVTWSFRVYLYIIRSTSFRLFEIRGSLKLSRYRRIKIDNLTSSVPMWPASALIPNWERTPRALPAQNRELGRHGVAAGSDRRRKCNEC